VVTEFNVGFQEHGIEVEHFMPGQDGVYIKKVKIPAGKALAMHSHTFTHKSVLAAGNAELSVDGASRIIEGPAVLEIRQGMAHSVTAITDCVWLCVHATDEKDPGRIDQTLVQEN
jgi:quercetin dioxygenase-like cupin family protein